jgi:hypothetical protein
MWREPPQLVKASPTILMHLVLFRPTSIDELSEFHPTLAQSSVIDMVRYEGDNFDDIYDLTFSVSDVTTYTVHTYSS